MGSFMSRLLLSMMISGLLSIHPAKAEDPTAVSPAVTIDDLIAMRRGVMDLQRSLMEDIMTAIATNTDVTPLKDAGETIATSGKKMPGLFAKGAAPGHETRALAAIEANRDRFEKAAANLTAAAERLASAAAAGNRSGVISAYRETSLACAECHIIFRDDRAIP